MSSQEPASPSEPPRSEPSPSGLRQSPAAPRWISVQVPRYREFLRRALGQAVRRLGPGLEPVGEPMVSFSERSIGSRVRRRGELLWLRVAPFDEGRMDQEAWSGNLAANAILGVPKPVVEERVVWSEADPVPVEVAAELMTYVADRPVSAGREPAELSGVSEAWWSDLRGALDNLAGHPTNRQFRWHTAAHYEALLTAFYGGRGDLGPVPKWRTEHLDLHWNNVTAPHLWIIDWELWGTAVAGYGAATLYCTALAVPRVARRVRETFTEVLDSPAGRYAQLVVAAELLTQTAAHGEPLGPVREMHRLADELLG
ncbi:MAG TPA: hypothetical protein VFU73_09140 [Actinocrinis sp.]|nr:hypothetical protein [Actinocrinis sp.]